MPFSTCLISISLNIICTLLPTAINNNFLYGCPGQDLINFGLLCVYVENTNTHTHEKKCSLMQKCVLCEQSLKSLALGKK